ncbi:SCO6880 family protein [Nocardioides hankookensis]
MTTEVPMTRFGRRQTRGVLLGFSGPRVAALGTAAVILGLALVSGVLALALVPVTVLVAATFVRWQGRPVVESVGVVTHWGARRALGQTTFRVRVEEPRPAGSMALPGDAAALRFLATNSSGYGSGPASGSGSGSGGGPGIVMVHDPHRQTLTAVAEVSYRAFVLLDGYAQQRRVSSWARVQAAQASLGRTSTIQVMESVIPDPGRGVVGWWETHGIKDTSWAGGWASVQYADLMELYAPTSSTHRTLIAFGLDMRKARAQIRRAGRGVAGAAKVLATDIAQVEQALRRAELHVEGWLSEGELARVIRGAYDPVVDLEPAGAGASLSVAGPVAVDEHWDHLVHDSGVSVVLWISDWPRSETIPNFMHQLIFERGVRRTLSLFMRPVAQANAVREVRREKTDYIADRAQKQKMGQVLAESDSDEYVDVVTRERALNAGHADMRYTGLITITAASLEEARAAADTVRRSANACGMETEVLYGRQAQAFTAAALPLARPIT